MILKNFLQNVWKSNFLINTVLEVNQDFNIIFIQEPSWTTLRSILSTTNPKDIPLLVVPNHPNWLIFAREPFSSNDFPRVITYINVRLSSFCFSFRKDIINHRDILLASFFNNNTIFWIINMYSDSSHTTLKYLKNTEVNLLNLIIIAGNFNIRNSIWDLVFPHHSIFSDDLMIVSYASSTYPENYIPAVMPPPNHTSPPSTAATFLATRLMAVLQPSGYSVFHGGDTPIQLSLP